jgi:hypothetical protein
MAVDGYGHAESFGGLPTRDFDPTGELPEDVSAFAWRVEAIDHGASPKVFAAKLAALAERGGDEVRALVLGAWGFGGAFPLHALLDVAPRLSGLRAVYLADLVPEESEISWIEHGDITPLFAAFPGLEVLRVRGGTGLRLDPFRHDALRALVCESGGLPAGVVTAIGSSVLPALELLELWLGVEDYGGDSTMDDLDGVFEGAGLPALTVLGLCNSPRTDAIAARVVDAPVTARLDVLDLSLGTLGEEGVEALIAGRAALSHLSRLDLHHHFVPAEACARLVDALPGVEVDLSERQRPIAWAAPHSRFTAVSE